MLEELNINQVDLFKIDVEGAELKVLKGSENILKKRNKINYRDFSTCRN
jgi:FkbM family methyltransferase